MPVAAAATSSSDSATSHRHTSISGPSISSPVESLGFRPIRVSVIPVGVVSVVSVPLLPPSLNAALSVADVQTPAQCVQTPAVTVPEANAVTVAPVSLLVADTWALPSTLMTWLLKFEEISPTPHIVLESEKSVSNLPQATTENG